MTPLRRKVFEFQIELFRFILNFLSLNFDPENKTKQSYKNFKFKTIVCPNLHMAFRLDDRHFGYFVCIILDTFYLLTHQPICGHNTFPLNIKNMDNYKFALITLDSFLIQPSIRFHHETLLNIHQGFVSDICSFLH